MAGLGEKPKLTEEQLGNIHIVSGQVHPHLAAKVADYVGVELCEADRRPFANGELYVRHLKSVRGKHVYIIQSHVQTPELQIDGVIRQQRLLIDAAKRGSAEKITAMAPYLGYSRQDSKAKDREPVSASQVVGDFRRDGADRIISVDLHSNQIQGFFDGPYDHLTAFFELNHKMREIMKDEDPGNFVVVSPDAGRSKVAEAHAEHLGVDVSYIHKRRDRSRSNEVSINIVGEVSDKTCFVPDDMIDTGGTLQKGATALLESGAHAVYAFATHGIFSSPAEQYLGEDSPMQGVYVTDTLPQDSNQWRINGLEVLEIAPRLGHAIMEIETKGSISRQFDDQNHA